MPEFHANVTVDTAAREASERRAVAEVPAKRAPQSHPFTITALTAAATATIITQITVPQLSPAQ